MGVMVGGASGGSAIGVAPEARWIAVKIFDDAGKAPLSAIHQGFQWLLDPDGDPDTDDAPDVVNNSWGFVENLNECIEEFSPMCRRCGRQTSGSYSQPATAGPYRLPASALPISRGPFQWALLTGTPFSIPPAVAGLLRVTLPSIPNWLPRGSASGLQIFPSVAWCPILSRPLPVPPLQLPMWREL